MIWNKKRGEGEDGGEKERLRWRKKTSFVS